jgi:phosphoadenosine phosphosulfate reductase
MNLLARATDELAAIARDASRRLDGASAERVIQWGLEQFGDRFCITSSFADGVLAHVASRVAPGIDLLFLDTGLHFPQTLRVRDQVASTMALNVISVQPEHTVGQQDGQYGPRLFARQPDQCCALRKVEPLADALTGYDAWAAGLRRADGPTRARTKEVDFEYARGKVKLAPLARWTDADVQAYVARYHIPVNQLLNQGYASIGCWPCTRRTKPGEDARAGRWAAFDKTECGIHA